MDSRRMAVLLHPEHYADEIRTQSERDEILDEMHRLFVKPWFAAQLTHYGIKFAATASLDRLWNILEKAVDSGKVSNASRLFIRCKAADAYNEDTGTPLTLDISITKGGTHLAAHDFGLFEGTMVLSHSEEKLKFLDDIEGKQDSEASQDEYESDGRGYESESDDDLKQKETSLAQKVASGKRKATSAAEGGPTKQKGKKQKKTGMVPSLSRRVYYRM
ncbi:hypothetical protein CDEST_00365 [Colletotrichum destructivum]|uniref:Uncharacterized protein n=1 Tax=Colletotrichum destructivum TaxID=34406 RepID=A0AAX4HW12_9PEZI|nr:hypothetical protein CDEST_00365 [Colletotrichum destructivum]